MKVFLDVIAEQEDKSYGWIGTDAFEDLNKMLRHLVSTYLNIVNLRQLDREDKEKGDLYFEVYVKKVI